MCDFTKNYYIYTSCQDPGAHFFRTSVDGSRKTACPKACVPFLEVSPRPACRTESRNGPHTTLPLSLFGIRLLQEILLGYVRWQDFPKTSSADYRWDTTGALHWIDRRYTSLGSPGAAPGRGVQCHHTNPGTWRHMGGRLGSLHEPESQDMRYQAESSRMAKGKSQIFGRIREVLIRYSRRTCK
ncbi:uncharacterized protein BCR38DRAFT_414454 [Pseudomassariella vexata]|uniref:Uncharacterized protein n=1 Tax=Pseudomassariella vexata TaxID=1141098 RepID=A0A1Y2DBS2_9PEZI|nr:uncharacterized protein BCR38DRAFT_414454 [Pseudomassariella vexata]ORY56708.1 hypothetical protein BCR38DRAFT_414454 [Pseudomassariella vexata]